MLICTYSYLAYGQKREEFAKVLIDFIQEHNWGLMIMDEVQVVPANNFRKVCQTIKYVHCKLGLTATLVREDGKI